MTRFRSFFLASAVLAMPSTAFAEKTTVGSFASRAACLAAQALTPDALAAPPLVAHGLSGVVVMVPVVQADNCALVRVQCQDAPADANCSAKLEACVSLEQTPRDLQAAQRYVGATSELLDGMRCF